MGLERLFPFPLLMNDIRWKRNNALTQQYAAFYDSIKNRVRIHFHKVAAHTGDTYNEMADVLAKKGAGI